LGYLSDLFNRFITHGGGLVQGSNFVARRTALEKIHGFNTKIDFYGEDTDLGKRMHKVGPVLFGFDAPIYTSGRRLVSEGIIKMAVRYPLNYFWILLFDKPFSIEHTDIRSVEQNPKFRTDVGLLAGYLNMIVPSLAIIFFLGFAVTRFPPVHKDLNSMISHTKTEINETIPYDII
jgi:hypothetical protein